MATTREVAGIYARVPETVLLLLFVGSALTHGMVGYSAGLTGRRSTLTVSQLPLVQLQEQIGPPTP